MVAGLLALSQGDIFDKISRNAAGEVQDGYGDSGQWNL